MIFAVYVHVYTPLLHFICDTRPFYSKLAQSEFRRGDGHLARRGLAVEALDDKVIGDQHVASCAFSQAVGRAVKRGVKTLGESQIDVRGEVHLILGAQTGSPCALNEGVVGGDDPYVVSLLGKSLGVLDEAGSVVAVACKVARGASQ